MKRTMGLFLALIITAVVGMACGSDGDEATSTATSEGTTPTVTPTTEVMSNTPTPTEEMDGMLDGQQLAQSKGCLGCHTTDGSALVGPTWKGLYGSTRELQDGTTMTADEAYLDESIEDPGAKAAVGTLVGVMPIITLTHDEIHAIIEYIESLQ